MCECVCKVSVCVCVCVWGVLKARKVQDEAVFSPQVKEEKEEESIKKANDL